jgi:hypothetical protein
LPYAAVITSATHALNLLEDIAPSFSSPIATIRRRDNQWILESSSFEPYESDEKLYEAANNLLSQIHHVLALYLGRHGEPLSVSALIMLTDDDQLIARRRYYTQTFDIVPPAQQVFNPTASGSLATDLLSRAATDPAILEALSLVGYEAPTWGQIYDIIEFLGGPRSIKTAGFASETKAAHVKRTANHYRHLGNPAKYPLPSKPPTLGETRMFAINLMKTWIAARISASE